MNKEENKKIIAAHKKIRELQEQLNEAIKEKNKLVQDSYYKDIKGKFIRIVYYSGGEYFDGEYLDGDYLDYIKEYINVENIYIDDNDNITYSGKGFKYVDGGYIDNIYATYNEMYQRRLIKAELNNGNVKVVKVTKEEFEKELSNMLDFIKENGKQYRN